MPSWCAPKSSAPSRTLTTSRTNCARCVRRCSRRRAACEPDRACCLPTRMSPDAERWPQARSKPATACPACGTPYPVEGDGTDCPVCLLQGALDFGVGGGRGEGPRVPEETRFDHYALVQRADGAFEELGRGAMGVTYQALDTVLGRAVALKVIDARVAARPEARERLLREARAAARLLHPNVDSVF